MNLGNHKNGRVINSAPLQFICSHAVAMPLQLGERKHGSHIGHVNRISKGWQQSKNSRPSLAAHRENKTNLN